MAVIAGSAIYYLLRSTAMNELLATAISMAVTMIIRISATYYHWDLPSVHGK